MNKWSFFLLIISLVPTTFRAMEDPNPSPNQTPIARLLAQSPVNSFQLPSRHNTTRTNNYRKRKRPTEAIQNASTNTSHGTTNNQQESIDNDINTTILTPPQSIFADDDIYNMDDFGELNDFFTQLEEIAEQAEQHNNALTPMVTDNSSDSTINRCMSNTFECPSSNDTFTFPDSLQRGSYQDVAQRSITPINISNPRAQQEEQTPPVITTNTMSATDNTTHLEEKIAQEYYDHHFSISFDCPLKCPSKNMKYYALVKHMLQDHTTKSEGQYTCNKCHTTIENNNEKQLIKDTKQHLKTYINEHFICMYCSEEFYKLSTYYKHCKYNHAIKSNTFQCPEQNCNLKLTFLPFLIIHMARYHDTNYKTFFAKTLDPAQVGSTYYHTPQEYYDYHYFILFSCPCTGCLQNPMKYYALVEHMLQDHTIKSEGQYKCNKCNKTFVNNDSDQLMRSIKQHLKTHIKENFTCMYCSKELHTFDNHNNHVKKIHATEKTKRICPNKECHISFNFLPSLIIHLARYHKNHYVIPASIREIPTQLINRSEEPEEEETTVAQRPEQQSNNTVTIDVNHNNHQTDRWKCNIFKCPNCHVTKKLPDLINHMVQEHTIDAPNSDKKCICTIKNCNIETNTEWIKTHMLTHINEDIHCAYSSACLKPFVTYKSYQHHCRNKHADDHKGQFTCHLCSGNYTYSFQDFLDRHLSYYHDIGAASTNTTNRTEQQEEHIVATNPNTTTLTTSNTAQIIGLYAQQPSNILHTNSSAASYQEQETEEDQREALLQLLRILNPTTK